MVSPSFTEIRDQIGRELANLGSEAAQATLVSQLSELRFEINQIKEQQRTLLAALRARDVVVRDGLMAPVTPVRTRFIDLDPRDSLGFAEGIRPIEWDGSIPIRWTGPGQETTFRVWLDRTVPVHLEVRVQSFGDDRNRGSVGLTVDGLPVSLSAVSETELRSADFPVLDRSLFSEVVLHVPHLSIPLAGEGASQPKPRSRRGNRAAVPVPQVEPGQAKGIAISMIRFSANI